MPLFKSTIILRVFEIFHCSVVLSGPKFRHILHHQVGIQFDVHTTFSVMTNAALESSDRLEITDCVRDEIVSSLANSILKFTMRPVLNWLKHIQFWRMTVASGGFRGGPGGPWPPQIFCFSHICLH